MGKKKGMLWKKEVQGGYRIIFFKPLSSVGFICCSTAKLTLIQLLFVYTCAQVYLTLCTLIDCSLPDFSVHGSFQARILEQVDISYPGIELASLVLAVDFLPLRHLGSPISLGSEKQNLTWELEDLNLIIFFFFRSSFFFFLTLKFTFLDPNLICKMKVLDYIILKVYSNINNMCYLLS